MSADNPDILRVIDILSAKRVGQLRGTVTDPQPQLFVVEGRSATFLLVRNPHRINNGHLRDALQHGH